MSIDTKILPEPERLRRLAGRSLLVTQVLLATLIFGMVNYLALRHYQRWHGGHRSFSRLADQSLRILDAVPGRVRITVLVRPTHPAYRPVSLLLEEYAAQTGKVSVEWVHPDRDVARAEECVQQYQLVEGECLVVETGARHRVIPADDLFTQVTSPDIPASTKPLFRGEQLVSGSLQAFTQTAQPAVYFVQGHGEHSPEDFDRRQGYSRIAAQLRDANLDVATLTLGETHGIPNNCALLIIAGPRREFVPFEIALIRDYLNHKGRVLALLDARVHTGLEALFRDWGIRLSDDIVVDDSLTISGRDLYITNYAEHPITTPLQGLASVFYLPRSIRLRPFYTGGDKPWITPLVTSTAAGWAEATPDDPAPHFDPRADLPGPVPLAVAIERGPIPGVHAQIRPTRLVVVGDSDFAANGNLAGANANLFLNAVHWLLDREDVAALPPQPLPYFQVVMNARQLQCCWMMLVIGLPLLMAAAGLGMAWRRRA